MIPAAPFVGAVTTRPPAAFSSFTASAYRLTQSMTASGSPPAPSAPGIEPVSTSERWSPLARRRTASGPGSVPSSRSPRSMQASIAAQIRQQPGVDLRVRPPATLVLAHDRGDRAPRPSAIAQQLVRAVVRDRELVDVRDPAVRRVAGRRELPADDEAAADGVVDPLVNGLAWRVEGAEADVVDVERRLAVGADPGAEHEVRRLVEGHLVPAEDSQHARFANRRQAGRDRVDVDGVGLLALEPEEDRLVRPVPAARRAERAVELGAHAARCAPGRRDARAAARTGARRASGRPCASSMGRCRS